MTRRTMLILGMGATSATLLLFNACSSDNSTGDAGPDATSDVSTQDSGSQDATPDTGSSDGGSDAAPAVCQDAGAACHQCCITSFGADAATFFRSTLHQCACTTPGDCASDASCGSNFCTGGLPDQACGACLADPDAGGCLASTVQACANNTECAPVAACIKTCGDGG